MNRALWTVMLGAGCAAVSPSTNVERIDITESNDLGVRAIEIEQQERADDTLFEVRGLDASDQQLAAIRLNVGVIADLTRYVPGTDNVGAEIVLSTAGSADQRVLSRELEYHYLANLDGAIAKFAKLGAVTSALAHQHILVPAFTPGGGGEAPYTTGYCPASTLNTSPTAEQCCITYAPNYANYTDFYASNIGALVLRYQGAYGNCKAQDGSSCSGSACFWGPNGFSKPQTWVSGGYPTIYTTVAFVNGSYTSVCQGAFVSSPQNHEYIDVTGTFPNNQGCPGGATGAGLWDY